MRIETIKTFTPGDWTPQSSGDIKPIDVLEMMVKTINLSYKEGTEYQGINWTGLPDLGWDWQADGTLCIGTMKSRAGQGVLLFLIATVDGDEEILEVKGVITTP